MSPLSKVMDQNEQTKVFGSPIQEFYRDACVLVSGGTGFLGKVLVEKLLRSCPHIGQIILLIRSKKEAHCQERLDALMEDTILKSVAPKNRLKVTAVSGDCTFPGLGLSDSDRLMLHDTVNVVFHVAATVRFDEDLASAVAINVVGTKSMLDLARDMKKLKAFVHVSTAYSQCHLKQVDEQFYPALYNPEKLIRLTQCVEKQYLDKLTPMLLKESPNTYVYTKAIAEELVRTQSKGIPVSVFRPSIVVATHNEPFPGWIDNLYGPTGVVVATTTGIMRSLHCDPGKTADIVPADMVVNALIATAWTTHLRNNKIETAGDQPQVFNFVSSPEKPIKWSRFFTLGMRYQLPTVHTVWYPSLTLTSSRLIHSLQHWLYLVVPAFLVDSAARTIGKRTNLMKIARKVDRFGELISYFATRQWAFSNNNVQEMWGSLTSSDRELFPFTFHQLEWESYFQTYIRGARQYLLKDDLSTVPRATARVRRFFWIHQTMKAVIFYFLVKIMWKVGTPLLRFVYSLTNRSLMLR